MKINQFSGFDFSYLNFDLKSTKCTNYNSYLKNKNALFIKQQPFSFGNSSIYPVNNNIPDYKQKLLCGISVFLLTTGIFLVAGKNKLKAHKQVCELKKIAKASAKSFSQDFLYKKKLAAAMGLSGYEYKLNSIAGTQELTYITQKFANTPEIFSPGRKIFAQSGAVLRFDEANVRNLNYGVNLHMHTVNSDGKLTVKELLDNTAEYANKYYKKHKMPFYCAITDHDTIESCKQALEILTKNPEKYKNLRLFLGSELTVTYNNPEFLSQKANIHVLLYGLNPFDEKIGLFLNSRIKKNKASIQNAIFEANKLFSVECSNHHFKYDFNEMLKLTPSIAVSIKDATYYLKDYLQFKLIFASMVENNPKLKDLGLKLSEVCYTKPIDFIPKNLDYSRGQKYYEYYYEALKSYITRHLQIKNPEFCADEIQKSFLPISKNLHQTLTNIENTVLNPNSKLHVAPNNLPDLTSAMTILSELADGKMSLAHPGVFFPMCAIKDKDKVAQMYEQIYKIFKNSGKNNAIYSEDFYQSHYSTDNSFTRILLENISQKYSLLKTGGLDTHGKNIFSI